MMLRALFTLLILANIVRPAVAVDLSSMPNDTEMLRLPIYCQDKLSELGGSKGSSERPLWPGRIGKNWGDFHHYCMGLNFVNRYWGARVAKDRSFYLQRAMNNFNYMVKAEKPDFALRAELYSNRGEVFKLQNKPGEAERDFRHAIELDPKLTKPYLQLIDLYDGRKQRAEALGVATSGLRHIPDSKAMQRRYLELGGKKPFPEPLVAKVAEPVLPQPVEPTPIPEMAIEPVPASAVATESEPAATTESQPPIGTQKNPYCRFCPPE